MIIQYLRVGVKHTWQVYVTSQLKVKLFCFFTFGTMIWIFESVEKRYVSAVLKFATVQNEPKWVETK